jgi:hypothetical protein
MVARRLERSRLVDEGARSRLALRARRADAARATIAAF